MDRKASIEQAEQITQHHVGEAKITVQMDHWCVKVFDPTLPTRSYPRLCAKTEYGACVIRRLELTLVRL
jgi:hypothetical protein